MKRRKNGKKSHAVRIDQRTNKISHRSSDHIGARTMLPEAIKSAQNPLKLHLGCGYKILDGYINIDLYSPVAQLQRNISDLSCFEDCSVEEIYLNAVFEHLYVFEQRRALAEWWRVLKPGGRLVIHSIPDFDEVVRAYINHAPGNYGRVFDIEEVSRYTHGAYGVHDKLGQIHKDVFNKSKIRELLERAGFEIVSMENVCWGEKPNPVNLNVVAIKTAAPIRRSPHGHEDEQDLETRFLPLESTKMNVAAVYCVHDDDTWLSHSIESVYSICRSIYVLVSNTPWFGEPGDNGSVVSRVESLPDPSDKIRVVKGSWQSEAEQRNAGLDILYEEKVEYCLVIDADEIYDPVDLERVIRIAQKHPEISCWHVEMDTYWKSWMYRVYPREQLRPVVLLRVGTARFTRNRGVSECTHGIIPPEVAVCHHLSYVRSDEQIKRKIATFSHARELVPGWYENVWKEWDTNPLMRNLHPTHPSAYGQAILQPYWALPPVLRKLCRSELDEQRGDNDYLDRIKTEHLVSIVILTCNQLSYTRKCLESIEKHTQVPHEIIVVDNGSSDGTTRFLEEWATKGTNRYLVLSSENLGFAKGNNLGIAKSAGRYVVLINNDVVVTPGWLEKLLACSARDASIGIVGPVTNSVSGPQYVDQPLYDLDSLAGLDDFAEDWSDKHCRQTLGVVRVVGFCVLIRREVIDKIGGLDEQYGLGNFEDDDFCLRAAIAGFKSVIARDCYVHHYGSRTFAGENIDYRSLMVRNWELFKKKWGYPKDLKLGCGYDATMVLCQTFDPSIHYFPLPSSQKVPETSSQVYIGRENSSKPLLTLCMIVRDEEQFIEHCLESVRSVVDEIVVVDTGSGDRTVQIAQKFGAKIRDFGWNDNYSDARNYAAGHARGEWILFLDADEVLDPGSGKLIRQAVESPFADAYELLFYNYCRGGGSTPDIVHRACRLYRNRPEYRFEGRVHENIAPSIVAAGGSVAELDVIIHHYGYRPDVLNRRQKRERYLALLHAELKDKPGDVYVLYHLSAAYCAENRFEEALPYLEQLVSSIPADHAFAPQSYSRLANAYWAVGRHEDAIVIANRAESMGIIHPEIAFSKGNALLALERCTEAVEAFETAIKIGSTGNWLGDPGTYGYKARLGIARALAGLEKYEEALLYAERVIEECGNCAQAHELAALLCMHVGDLVRAESHWLHYLRVVPNSPVPCCNLAQIYENQGRYQEALHYYHKAIENGAASAELYQKAAACSEILGDLARAEEWYIRAIETNPNSAEAYNDLGRLYAARNEVQSALDCFARAVEVQPDYANAFFNAGDVLYGIGKYLEAAEVYESGLAKDPTRAEGFLALGNCCFRLGAYDAAVIAYRQALTINPHYEEARHNMLLAEEALKKNSVAQ
ncbi:MAG: glycosyltransferase [Armatimonadota bacterium]